MLRNDVKLAVLIAGAALAGLANAKACDVKIGGALGRVFDLTVTNNFLKLELERDFYPPFVERTSEEGFIGLGMLADAAVHFARHSGDPAVVARKDAILKFISDHQLADGYTGFMKEGARLGRLWDIHEMGFVIQAFVADWEFFGNRASLEVARRNADYIIDNWNSMPPNWEFTFITDKETTLGLGMGIVGLYEATKDVKYLDFLRHVRDLEHWDDPIVVGRDKMIYGQASGYLSACTEQLALFGLEGNRDYLRPSLRAFDFMVRGDGLLIDGNGGVAECWTDDQDGNGSVGETCTATYMLCFYDQLIRQGVADASLVGDLMERVVLNGLFGAQSRDGRRLRYYTPLNGVRTFWKDDLYCCANNFRRAVSRLPEYVFYVRGNALVANLFTACRAEAAFGGAKVRIAEETDYPKDGKVRFAFDPDRETSFTFRLRIPRWCVNPTVRVNGEPVTYKYAPGQLLNLPRVWRKGDVVELDCPMPVRTVRGRGRQSGRFAVMRGPVVYAMDTRKVDAFAKMHPLDVETKMMMDPTRLEYRDGKILAYVSTVEWAVGVADVSVDGMLPENVRRVELVPFADEDNTLTYFRAPNINETVREEDELFGRSRKGNR